MSVVWKHMKKVATRTATKPISPENKACEKKKAVIM